MSALSATSGQIYRKPRDAFKAHCLLHFWICKGISSNLRRKESAKIKQYMWQNVQFIYFLHINFILKSHLSLYQQCFGQQQDTEKSKWNWNAITKFWIKFLIPLCNILFNLRNILDGTLKQPRSCLNPYSHSHSPNQHHIWSTNLLNKAYTVITLIHRLHRV